MTQQAAAQRVLFFRFSLFMAVMLVISAPSAAWTVPDTSGNCQQRFSDRSSWSETRKDCQFSAQLEPSNVVVGGEKDLGTGYYIEPHVYEIENAVRLFREKGYDNWALYLSSPDHFQALADGVTWADAYKGRVLVHISIHILWVEVYSWKVDNICNYAGFDQYYNTYEQDPAGRGLDSEGINVLADYLPVLIKTIGPALVEIVGGLVGFPGLGGLLSAVSADIHPELESAYPSGALQAQQHFDRAIDYHFNSATDPQTGQSRLYWPQRSVEYNSLFQLGWATHYMQDIGVIYHMQDITSSLPPNPHNDYENNAKGHGDPFDQKSGDYHISAAGWTLGTDYLSKSITQLARDEAIAINDGNDWAAARSHNEDVRLPVVQKGVRVSEQFTAAMLAKYLNATGVPQIKQPFQGRVEDGQDRPVSFAYVFYRKGMECIQDPDKATPVCGTPPGAWNYVRADKDGRFSLDLKPSDISKPFDTYFIRPVMPGYRYTGYFQGSSSESMGATRDGKTLEYQPPWKTVAVTVNPYYEFYLDPLAEVKQGVQLVTVVPGILLFTPGELPAATEDTIRKNLITVTPESTSLRVHTQDPYQSLMIPLPETTYVEVQLANIVDLNQPRILTSPSDIRSTVVAVKNQRAAWYAARQTGMVQVSPAAGAGAARLAVDEYIPASTKDSWYVVLSSLPKTSIHAQNGTTVAVPDLAFAFGTGPSISGEFLPAIGLARVPAANSQVEVTLSSGTGYIGPEFSVPYTAVAVKGLTDKAPQAVVPDKQGMIHSAVVTTIGSNGGTSNSGFYDVSGINVGSAPSTKGSQSDAAKKHLILTTDSSGRVALMFWTGNQAGRVRMNFRVISNPNAPGVLPQHSVEFTVHPLVKEVDPDFIVPPNIQAVQPREIVPSEIIEAGAAEEGAGEFPTICFNLTPDGGVTEVLCPSKPITGVVIDFITSIPSTLGRLMGSSQPSLVVTSRSIERGDRQDCNDSNACTVQDRMVQGSCTGDLILCNDDNPGSIDRCEPATGCVFESPVIARDTCDPVSGCIFTPIRTSCDDLNRCTVNDRIVDGTCTGDPLTCDDRNPETADICDPRKGCVFTPSQLVITPGVCNDGNLCTVNDQWVDGVCWGDPLVCDDGNPDTRDTCDPESGCIFTPISTTMPAGYIPCDDGNACTENDRIIRDVCTGSPRVCDDGNPRTQDTCDPVSGCIYSRVPITTPTPAMVCPEGCTCMTPSEALQIYGHAIRCSDTPCAADYSIITRVLYKYCYRPAG
jgi:hypothetical protein